MQRNSPDNWCREILRQSGQSWQLFSSARRRYSGIMLDVLYDHFLSRHWSVYTDQPKRQFIDGIYLLLEQNIQMLPPKLAEIAPGMIANDWLGSYEDIDVIGVVYDRISIRIKRENTMSGGLEEVSAHYAELEQHFLSFFPLVMNYADELNQRSFPANAG